jgi:formate hydrogenlyase subunit 3/multisubunit Na+/H+ antiporter MnhD subunit
MARVLIALGIILVVVGLAWPWIAKLGFGRLPGDFHFERDGFSFYFPLTTGLIISVVLSLVLWLLRK